MKIGQREVVYSAVLIIPGGEDAWVDFHVDSWSVRLHILFESIDDEGQKQGLTIEAVEDHGKITFTNWVHPLGTATVAPVELGKTKGRALVFMASHHLIGTTNRLELQFMLAALP